MTDRDHSKTRLRVVGTGRYGGTNVETEHGQRIKGVQSVTWELRSDERFGTATIVVRDVEIDIDTERKDDQS